MDCQNHKKSQNPQNHKALLDQYPKKSRFKEKICIVVRYWSDIQGHQQRNYIPQI